MPKQIKQGLTLLYLFIYCSSQGQSTYFDRRFDTLLSVNSATASFLENDGYSTVVFGFQTTQIPKSTLCYRKIDFEGQEQSGGFCFYFDSLFFFNTWTSRDENGNFIVLGYAREYDTVITNRGIAIYKFNTEGEILFSKHIFNDTINYLPTNLIAHNSDIDIVGQTYVDDYGDAFLMRIDSTGNILFEKRYGGSQYEAALSMVATPDDGYLLLGWTISYGSGQKDWYLVKTDSLGNQEWQKTYGTGANESGWGIIALQDGNYLLGGGGANPGVNGWAELKKINQLGDIIWQKQFVYPGTLACSIYWPRELADGNIVAVGLSTSNEESDAGWLLKTDIEGNEIWQQKYNISDGPDLFYDALATADGGYLLTGFCVNEASNNTDDGWLLKVDSLGCPYPNCTVGIEEESKVVAFNMWPNPASGLLNLEVFSGTETTITIKDLFGKEVYHSVFSEAKMAVDVTLFKKGLYMVEVSSANHAPIIKKVVIA
jgi:hypothetical protein